MAGRLQAALALSVVTVTCAGQQPAVAVPAVELDCAAGDGCEVICYQAGAGEASRNIVLQRSGVRRVRDLGQGWLHLEVADSAAMSSNFSGVLRLSAVATCWFARMQPVRHR